MLPVSVVIVHLLGLGKLTSLQLLFVCKVSSIVLQVLVEKAVGLGDQEHQLVKHFTNDVLPILLVALFLGFCLLRILDTTHHE